MEWEKTDATTDEAPGKARAGEPTAARSEEPGAARMNEEPAAQSGTDGQDLESEAAQPDVGGASQAATNAPAVQTGKPTAARTGEPTAAQAGETTASQAGESVKDAPAAQSKAATNAPAVQTGKTTAAQAGEPTAARAGESFAAQSGGRGRLLRQLFFATLYISACTFGGGFVIVTFMRRRFVEQLHWLDEREMLDFTALAQSAPGAIAVNAAVLVGWRVAGFCGMLAAALGTVLPPMVILSVISLGYRAFADNRCVALALGGMQAGVAAVVLDVVCGLGGTVLRERSPLHIAVMAAAFIAGALLGVNVVYVILAAALAGVGHALLRRRARGARP